MASTLCAKFPHGQQGVPATADKAGAPWLQQHSVSNFLRHPVYEIYLELATYFEFGLSGSKLDKVCCQQSRKWELNG